MKRKKDQFSAFVDHPRFGRRPKLTGLNPSPADPDVHLHWNAVTRLEIAQRYESLTGKKWPFGDSTDDYVVAKRIPNTAIPADLARQAPATVPATHYFDLERTCRDCRRPFIFFAEEQKHWYEELGFGLDSDCVRCVECRKRQQGVARERELYESLFHVRDKTEKQTLAMAGACLTLIEQDLFSHRQLERVRMLLNSISSDSGARKEPRYMELVSRMRQLEANHRDDAT